jgi:hypothetical protein
MTLSDLNRLTDDLEVAADWRDELSIKLRRAQLRFELPGLHDDEREALEAEVEDCKEVLRCLYRTMRGRLT